MKLRGRDSILPGLEVDAYSCRARMGLLDFSCPPDEVIAEDG